MKIRVAVPMNNYRMFEIIYETSKFNLFYEYVRAQKILLAEIVTYKEAVLERAMYKIIHRLKNQFPMPAIYRLHIDNNCYIEETVTHENIDNIPNYDIVNTEP